MISALDMINQSTGASFDLFSRVRTRTPLTFSTDSAYDTESGLSFAVMKQGLFKPRSITLNANFRSQVDRDEYLTFLNTDTKYRLRIVQDGIEWVCDVFITSHQISKYQVQSYELYEMQLTQLNNFRTSATLPVMSNVGAVAGNTSQVYTYTYPLTYAQTNQLTGTLSQLLTSPSGKEAPVKFVIQGYSANPRWEVRDESGVLLFSGGYNGVLATGEVLTVDSWWDTCTMTVNNVDKRDMQDWSGVTFFSLPKGKSIVTFYNCSQITMSAYVERELI